MNVRWTSIKATKLWGRLGWRRLVRRPIYDIVYRGVVLDESEDLKAFREQVTEEHRSEIVYPHVEFTANVRDMKPPSTKIGDIYAVEVIAPGK